jgi:hypothetical protein
MIIYLKTFFRITLLLLTFFYISPAYCQSKIHIGVIHDHIAKAELTAIEKVLKNKHLNYEIIVSHKQDGFENVKRFTHIWYHRTDTVDFDKKEISLGTRLIQYVKNGGNIFLSMESVPLLNKWHIESNPIQYDRCIN